MAADEIALNFDGCKFLAFISEAARLVRFKRWIRLRLELGYPGLKKAQLKNTIWNLPGQNWCNMQASSRAKSSTFSKGFRKAIKNVRGSKGSTVNFRYLWTKLRPTA